MQWAERSMERINDPTLVALHFMAKGLIAHCEGHWADALEFNDRAQQSSASNAPGSPLRSTSRRISLCSPSSGWEISRSSGAVAAPCSRRPSSVRISSP